MERCARLWKRKFLSDIAELKFHNPFASELVKFLMNEKKKVWKK